MLEAEPRTEAEPTYVRRDRKTGSDMAPEPRNARRVNRHEQHRRLPAAMQQLGNDGCGEASGVAETTTHYRDVLIKLSTTSMETCMRKEGQQ